MIRRTKILATLGPSTDEPDTLKGILDAGVNVVRINFSHNNEKEHLARIAQIRQYEEENDVFIGLMMDLQGPKIRIASFKSEKIELKKGDQFTLDAGLAEDAGDQKSVGLAYKQLPNDLSMGNTLLLDDGKIILQVEQISGKKIKKIGKIELNSSKVFDATNKVILPGIIDTQVHFREPGSTNAEDLESGSRAAVLGGVTSLFEMPNTNPNTTSVEEFNKKITIASNDSFSNFSFMFGGTNDNIDEIKKLNPSEVAGIKLFLGSSTGKVSRTNNRNSCRAHPS